MTLLNRSFSIIWSKWLKFLCCCFITQDDNVQFDGHCVYLWYKAMLDIVSCTSGAHGRYTLMPFDRPPSMCVCLRTWCKITSGVAATVFVFPVYWYFVEGTIDFDATEQAILINVRSVTNMPVLTFPQHEIYLLLVLCRHVYFRYKAMLDGAGINTLKTSTMKI